jgi:hypothetical protein
MCCVDSRLVHYCILGRQTAYVSGSAPFECCLNMRVGMKVQTLLNMLYFKQGVRELYKLYMVFLTFFYVKLVHFFNTPLNTVKQMASLVSVQQLRTSALQHSPLMMALSIAGHTVVLVTVQKCSCEWFYRFCEWFCCGLCIL